MDSADKIFKTAEHDLYPLTLLRPLSAIRAGVLTIEEKWTALKAVFPELAEPHPANILPIMLTGDDGQPKLYLQQLQYAWELMQYNDQAIRSDVELLTRNRQSAPIPEGVQLIGKGMLFIEAGARVYPCSINTENGPVYIGPNSTIMEGAMIRGPFALCKGAVVKMGARIYGATTIGAHAVAGGEIKNSILGDYSNKAHDGYLGDSVIGNWCNLGAGTSTSNVKNTASTITVRFPGEAEPVDAGIKCGLIMGDHSRAAINTSFNSGTVTGICCNIFSAGLTPKTIPSFSWGGEGNQRYDFDKAVSHINNWMKFKDMELSAQDIQAMKVIFDAYN